MKDSCLELIKSVADLQEDFVVIFKDEKIVLTNRAFNAFFGVESLKEYQRNFGEFVDNFVPHPSYFNINKVEDGETWFDAILKLDEIDRVVSLLSQNYDPHAYSVAINDTVESFKVVTFTDITQTLIKRIMIEHNASLDQKSGAYSKQYFMQIKQSYEDASIFNEKIIGLTQIDLLSQDTLDDATLQEFVTTLKNATRNDDMLVRWDTNSFLLAYLVDDEENAKAVSSKIQTTIKSYATTKFQTELCSVLQKEKESVVKLVTRLSDAV